LVSSSFLEKEKGWRGGRGEGKERGGMKGEVETVLNKLYVN